MLTAMDHLGRRHWRNAMKNGLFSVALVTVAIVNMAAGASTEDRLISTSSGRHVEFLVEGTGPAMLMIPSLGRGASDFDDFRVVSSRPVSLPSGWNRAESARAQGR